MISRRLFRDVLALAVLIGAASGMTAAAPLTLGSLVSGQISDPGGQEQYTFNGTPGQRVTFDAQTPDSPQLVVRLVSPSGAVIFERNSRSDIEPVTLLEAGPYTLTVDGSGAATGPYTFRLMDVAAQPSLPLDSLITKTLSPGSAADYYALSGTAGQRLYFDSVGASGSASWTLYAPNNQPLAGTGIAGDFEVTLPYAGTYLLAIQGASSSPLPFSVQAVSFTVTTNALTLGTAASGTIGKPGDQRAYTFQGAAGQRVIYDALDLDPAQINVRLISPGGAVVFERNSRSDLEPVTLAEPGTYTLVIDGNGAATGSYNFRLIDVAARPALDLNTPVSNTLAPGASADIFRLAGTAGQRIYFDGMVAIPGATWYLYSPNNQQLGGAAISSDFEVTLPVSGTYVVAVWGTATAALLYSIRAIETTNPANAITAGAVVSSAIANPGDQRSYTFNGTAGQRIYYDALNRQFGQIVTRAIGPGGGVLWDTDNASNDKGPLQLLESGAYTISVDGNAAAVGDFAFRLLDLASAPVLNIGANTTGQLSPASATAAYQFNGSAGQRINFKTLSSGVNQAAWRLVGTANQNLASTGISSDLGDVVLPATGTYYLLVEGTTDNQVPLNFQFLATDKSDAPVAVSGLGGARSGTIAAGQQDTLSFNAPAGTWVYFDSLDRTANQSGLVAELKDAAGTVFAVGAGSDAGPYILPRSGAYSLVMRGSGAANAGPFSYRLLDLGSVPALALGSTINGQLNPGFTTDFYQFDGLAGQRLYYDALDATPDSVSVRLTAPDGQIRHLNSNSRNDVGPFTLAQSGRYFISFEGNAATASAYTARLLDLAAQPALVFGPLNVTFDPGTGARIYRFTVAPGERFAFNGAGNTGAGSWTVYGPNNETLGGTSFGGYFEAAASQPGTYALVLAPANPSTLTGSFGIYKPSQGSAGGGGFQISSLHTGAEDITVTWEAASGKNYRLQYKANLQDAQWTDLPGDVAASGASASKIDSTAGGAPRRFYRVLALP